MTHKRFPTIADYLLTDPDIRVGVVDWPGLSAKILREGDGDLAFARTDRHALVLTLDGSATHLTRMDGIEDPRPTRPDTLAAIPEGLEVHLAWTNRTPLQRTLMVEFDNDLFRLHLPELASDAFLRGHLRPATYAENPGLSALVRLVSREADPLLRQGRLAAETAMRMLAIAVAETAWSLPATLPPSPPAAPARIRRAIDYIESGFAETLSILGIAAAAGLSPTQLTRAFRSALGQSPYAYVVDRRLRAAAELLAGTDLPIAIVALESGFADQAHLTRLMRARLGLTPRKLRLERGTLRSRPAADGDPGRN